jgi:O-antigen ligase
MKYLKNRFSLVYYLLFTLLLLLYSFNKFIVLNNSFKIFYFLIPFLYFIYLVKQKYKIAYEIKILLFFIIIQLFSLINTFIFYPEVIDIVSFYFFREIIIVILLIPIYGFYFHNRKFFDQLLLFIAAVVAISNLLYYFLFYDFSVRFQGVFGGANEFAYMMVFLIYIIYYCLYMYKLKFKLFWVIILIILHLLVLVTLSRTAILGLIIFYIIAFPYFYKKFNLWKKILLFVMVIIFFILVNKYFFEAIELLFERFTNSEGLTSLESRKWEILAAINMLSAHPITIIFGNGTGITSSSIFITFYNGLGGGLGTRVHNAYFSLIVENGIISLLIFLYFAFYILKKIFLLKNEFKYVILGFFIFTLFFLGAIYLFYFLPFWLALFLIMSHIKIFNIRIKK